MDFFIFLSKRVAQIVDFFTTVSRVASVQLLVLFRLVLGNLHLSLIFPFYFP